MVIDNKIYLYTDRLMLCIYASNNVYNEYNRINYMATFDPGR